MADTANIIREYRGGLRSFPRQSINVSMQHATPSPAEDLFNGPVRIRDIHYFNESASDRFLKLRDGRTFNVGTDTYEFMFKLQPQSSGTIRIGEVDPMTSEQGHSFSNGLSMVETTTGAVSATAGSNDFALNVSFIREDN